MNFKTYHILNLIGIINLNYIIILIIVLLFKDMNQKEKLTAKLNYRLLFIDTHTYIYIYKFIKT